MEKEIANICLNQNEATLRTLYHVKSIKVSILDDEKGFGVCVYLVDDPGDNIPATLPTLIEGKNINVPVEFIKNCGVGRIQ